jgi:translation elongation factor EF-Ts
MRSWTTFTAQFVYSSRVFIKDPDHTIKELVATKIAELGENIIIRRFTRYRGRAARIGIGFVDCVIVCNRQHRSVV